jgi:AAA domain
VKNSYTVVHGKWESLKSLMLLEATRALVTQTPFLGKFQVYEKCKVLYVDEENANEHLKRAKRGLGLENLPDYRWMHQMGFKVDRAKDRKALFKTIKEGGFNVIVFDALVRMHNKDENSAEMKEIGNFFLKLARRGYTVIVIHHDNRSDDYRGSSDIPGAADQFYAFDYDRDNDRGTLTVTPQKGKLASTRRFTTDIIFSNVEGVEYVEFSVREKDDDDYAEGSSDEGIAWLVFEQLKTYPEGKNATEMEKMIRVGYGLSIPKARDLREKYTGRFWTVGPGPNNSNIYKVLDLQGAAV